jgi:hypothetical protein
MMNLMGQWNCIEHCFLALFEIVRRMRLRDGVTKYVSLSRAEKYTVLPAFQKMLCHYEASTGQYNGEEGGGYMITLNICERR